MAEKAVFLDRDRTIMEDPGYVSDPQAVKLLPGVELAIKSLAQAGYKILVVTNQSGVARGLLTEESLEGIHAEMRRQLAEKGAHVDAIYYCPYHPEGIVEKYAKESDLRKPNPGMLLAAADEWDLDLTASWMIGDSPRDVEAGQRAGCRTIRVRTGDQFPSREAGDEDVQADVTVRNLVEAARAVLRPEAAAARTRPSSVDVTETEVARGRQEAPAAQVGRQDMNDRQISLGVLRQLKQLTRAKSEEFSFITLLGCLLQVAVVFVLFLSVRHVLADRMEPAKLWALYAIVVQLMALTFFSIRQR